jgi:integrase
MDHSEGFLPSNSSGYGKMKNFNQQRRGHGGRRGRDRTSAKHLYPFFTGMLLNDITGPVVSDYIAQRRSVAAAGTINKEVGLLSSAINWAKRELGWEVQDPVDGRRLREPEGRIRWITKAEAASLLEAATYERGAPHLVDFVRLGLHTGMRKGEMLGLEWSRVDLTEGLVYLNREHQKNGKLGSVPLNGEARQAIRIGILKQVPDG